MLDQAEQAEIIDFRRFRLEAHVKRALETANTLANTDSLPVSAAHFLRAAIGLSGSVSSQAFATIARLLPMNSLSVDQGSSTGTLEMPVTPSLAQSVTLAEDFLQDGVWGRDFVTLALMADDPALKALVEGESVSLLRLRDDWFDFLTSSEQHRTEQVWQTWRSRVGGDTRGSAEGDAYLLTWNPTQHPESELEVFVEKLEREGSVELAWSSGSRKNLPTGSRVYLLRQSDDNTGIVGSGVTTGLPSIQEHWKPHKAKKGQKSLLVTVAWDRLSTSPIVSTDRLVKQTREEDLWHTRSGGVAIPKDIASVLASELGIVVTPSTVEDAARFAKTLSDLDHSNDWIGIRPDVEALSTLIGVNRLEPPLSIAIFGDWGSGKTFLMRKIQERVKVLEQIGQKQMMSTEFTAATGADQKTQKEGPARYCSSILQIEFNAWHYTESNLWASLLNHIFEKLQQKLGRKQSPEEAEQAEKARRDHVEKLFEQFETARAARAESEARINLMNAETGVAKDAVQAAKRQLTSAEKTLEKALSSSVWAAVEEELKGSPQGAELKKALAHFGFEDSLKSAQTVYSTVQQFRSVSGRAKEVLGSLLATRQGLLGAGVVVLAAITAMWVGHKYGISGLPLATSLVTGLAWIGERAATASNWLDTIETADSWMTSHIEAADIRIAQELESARLKLERCQRALSHADRQLHEARIRESTARADLEGATAREQMRRFVDDRISNRRYAQHLGLVSMIRRDFEDLSDFMYRDQQEGEARLVRRVTKETSEAIPNVERIILYIDDLDRCQPDRVVEVLEAVHLLMAFRLFVVVVAVDPRWVFESLKTRYPHLSTPMPHNIQVEAVTGTRPGMQQASTHDYIEKIFHIPFWVKPMTPNACKDLVAGYFDFGGKADNMKSDQGQISTDGSDKSGTPDEDERYHEQQTNRMAQESSVTEQSISNVVSSGTEEGVDDKVHYAAERAIRNVSISPYEQTAIKSLSPHLGNSPRRIKRFANIYRLLKSGLSRKEAASFTGKDGSDTAYRVALTFLAIVTGAPTYAPFVLANAYKHRREFKVITLIQGLDHIEGGDADELSNAKGALALLEGTEVEAKTVELWAPRVMRYGFNLTPIDVTEST